MVASRVHNQLITGAPWQVFDHRRLGSGASAALFASALSPAPRAKRFLIPRLGLWLGAWRLKLTDFGRSLCAAALACAQ